MTTNTSSGNISTHKDLPFYPYRYNKFSHYLRQQFGCRVQKIPINAGFTCPNRDGTLGKDGCIYCGAQGAAATLGINPGALQPLTVRQQILQGISNTLKRHRDCKFIAYFQAFSNTYAPSDTLNKLYKEALGVDPKIIGLAVGTRPDCLSDDIFQLLADYARRYYFWLELGLQSAHDKTLDLINRGHNVQQFSDTVKKAHSIGIKVCAHIILGLPGETHKQMLQTVHFLNKLKIDGVKIHNLYILKETKLAQLYQEQIYQPISQDEYVRLVIDFLAHLSPQIIIQRLVANPIHSQLLAPSWALKKGTTLKLIENNLEKNNIWQGKETFAN